jgi:hypothetical protein
MTKQTPVTQEFIIKLIVWAVLLGAIGWIAFSVNRGIERIEKHQDEEGARNATPITH